MRYLGGKFANRKEISTFLELHRLPSQVFFEPFCGGCSIVSEMSGDRIANDVHTSLMMMWQELQNGWIPPTEVSEEEFKRVKRLDDCALKAFIGFGCSFGATQSGGYARAKDRGISINFALQSKKSSLRKIDKMKDVTFYNKSYLEFTPENQLIYCDPPYKGTTEYKGTDKFDHDLFWQTMRKWSKNNTVFVSEYQAPPDFDCVWQKEKKLKVRSKNGCEVRIEKIFTINEIVLPETLFFKNIA